ncbi:amino acid ABC transporter substrate-binding protein [Enterococcus florum]|uniref:Amino acid ABC transporter substrate-binding protein n=1 Tax=Enterococcus florum TaxID=2480627 RepID=A0A4P5P3L5_9ENTE|nr:transporter substrate-binding domain-containing protein [Enterococcus florum]GCF92327.1 amino acid ABC transporter substrate-binding protein [Enterococcus florum]
MKKITGLAVSFFALFTLAACGGGDSSTGDSTSSANNAENQLEKIKEAGVLKVATSADFAPFEFHTMIDGKDKVVGADIDLVEEVAKDLGVKVDIMDMGYNTVLASLKEGKSDIAVAGLSATNERREQFGFSDDYYNPPQVIVINKKDQDTLTSIDAFAGKNVGGQKGSIQEDVVKEQLPDAKLVSIEKVPSMIVEVNQGSLDAMVLEKTIAESYVAQNSDLMIADVALESKDDEAYAIAVPKDGSDDLLKEINKTIKRLNDEGKIEEFVQKNNEIAEKAAKE